MADNNLQASFKKLMRYAQNLAEYEQGIAEGIIDDNTFVIVLDEKVAKFKGQTFDWSGGGSGNGGDFEVRTVYPTKQTMFEEETFDITEEERAYNMETLSKTLSGKTVFCKVGEAILFPTISMSGAVTEATYSTVVVLGGPLASYSLTITSDGDAEVAIAEVTTGGDGGGSNITVDSEMSSTSTNPVQNKVVKQYVDDSETKAKKYTDEKISQIEVGSGISQENADKRYIRKVVDNFDSDLTFAVADGIVGTDDEYYFIPAKAPSTASDSQILATKADVNKGGGDIDPSNFATKDELNNLNNEVIANEEVHAAALNDLEERKADKEYVEDALGNVDLSAKQDKIDDLDVIRSGAALGATAIQQVKTINGEEITGEGNIEIKADVDTSTLVTKEEFTDVEEVWAASYNLLNQKVSDVQQYIYDEAASRRQFDEAIAEIQSIIAENESVVTAAWNQLNTRINVLEAAQRG